MDRHDPYFDVAEMVLVIVTIGNHLEFRVKRAALGSRADLTDQRVDEARRLNDESDATESIEIDECEPSDRLLVKPGERIPIDGQIVDGTAAIDEALVAGESAPQRKSVRDDVLGGSILTDNAIVVEVSPDATSTMGRLVELLWNAKSSATGVQRIVNRFAVLFVLPSPFPSCSGSPPGYNVIALPLAMTSVITPLIAAVMMAISSLIVVFNSKRRFLPSNGEHSGETDRDDHADRLGTPAHSD